MSLREEMRDGFRYPDEQNAAFLAFGVLEHVQPYPSITRRVGRALEWGAVHLRERAARALAPR